MSSRLCLVLQGDEEDATLSRNRAGPGQKGKGPDEQQTGGSDAEESVADQEDAAEPSQVHQQNMLYHMLSAFCVCTTSTSVAPSLSVCTA